MYKIINEKIEYFTRNFTERWPFHGKPPISRSASRPRNREIGWAVAAAQKAYYKYCGYSVVAFLAAVYGRDMHGNGKDWDAMGPMGFPRELE